VRLRRSKRCYRFTVIGSRPASGALLRPEAVAYPPLPFPSADVNR
jgi:hypothetical protein